MDDLEMFEDDREIGSEDLKDDQNDVDQFESAYREDHNVEMKDEQAKENDTEIQPPQRDELSPVVMVEKVPVPKEDPLASMDSDNSEKTEKPHTKKAPKLKYQRTTAAVSKEDKTAALQAIEELKGRGAGTEDLECSLCDPPRSFTAYTTLLTHYRGHAGIKPFECHICQATFTRQHSLNYHLMTHNNQTRFTCPMCNRKFRHPTHYKEHMKQHGETQQISCFLCDVTLSTKIQYRKHLKTEHSKIPHADGTITDMPQLEPKEKQKKKMKEEPHEEDETSEEVFVTTNPELFVEDRSTTVKVEKTENALDIFCDASFHSNDYQMLKDMLEEARVTVEKAQEWATKLSQNQDSRSTDFLDYFTQVSSSIDQAVISTTMGLSALECILTIKQEEEDMETAEEASKVFEKEHKQEIQDEDTTPDNDEPNGIAEVATPEPEPNVGVVNGVKRYYCDLCDYSQTKKKLLQIHKRSKHQPLKYKCEKCDYHSNKPSTMKKHIKNVHEILHPEYICERENPENKLYLCKHCVYTNTDKEKMDEHIENNHETVEGCEDEQDANDEINDEVHFENESDGALLSCTRCSYTTRNEVYFNDHINGSYKYFKCPWCDRHFVKTQGMNFSKHLRKGHKIGTKIGRPFECPDCKMSFPQSRALLRHMHLVHKNGPMYHCPKCDYNGAMLRNLKMHMEEHNEASFCCEQCPHVAKSKQRLYKHIYMSHGQGFLCDDCGQVYTTIFNLKLHRPRCNSSNKHRKGIYIKSAHNRTRTQHSRNLLCTVCKAPTKTLVDLKRHYEAEHKKPGSTYEIEQKCEMCDHVLTSLSKLHHHYQMEHKEKIFKCDECDFEASIESKLRVHKELKHASKETSFSCEICGLVYKKQRYLNIHVKYKHSNKPLFSCTEEGCNYTINTNYGLKMHVEKVHLGIKWPCNLCQYMGPYKGDLTRHLKKVHNVIPEGSLLKCDLCDFTSMKSATFMAHKKKVHGVES